MSEVIGVSHYAQLDRVKLKLRMDQLPQDKQDTIDEELENYLNEVDEAINRELLARLGAFDEHGNEIEIPLTEDSNIPLDEDLILIATKWAVGKYRTEQNAEDELEGKAMVEFENYLDKRFGWGQGNRLHLTNLKTRIRVVPFGTGEGGQFNVLANNFRNLSILEAKLGGKVIETIPKVLFTDTTGKLSFVGIVPTPTNVQESLAGDAHILDVRELGLSDERVSNVQNPHDDNLDSRFVNYMVGKNEAINVAQIRFFVPEHTLNGSFVDAIVV